MISCRCCNSLNILLPNILENTHDIIELAKILLFINGLWENTDIFSSRIDDDKNAVFSLDRAWQTNYAIFIPSYKSGYSRVSFFTLNVKIKFVVIHLSKLIYTYKERFVNVY